VTMGIGCQNGNSVQLLSRPISAIDVDLVGSMQLHEVQLTTSYGHQRISSTTVFSAA
jgi:hypothetical protein